MKIRLNLFFDWKSMSVVAYVPLLIFVLVFLYSRMINYNLHILIPTLEYTIPAFSAWWSIFLLQDILEEEGTETILSYPVSRWNLGLTRLSIFFLTYLLFISIILITIQNRIKIDIFNPLFYQLSVEALFFSGLGFLSMVLTTNSGWSLGVVIAYVSTQILTKGALLPFTNIYLFNDRVLPISFLKNWSIPILCISFILWMGAQYIFKHTKRFN